ncbi:MAG: arp [Rickettsiaceae bacterium]|jgi:hypothetical protein|nr:arp [Rickettsiaceae bacterium]
MKSDELFLISDILELISFKSSHTPEEFELIKRHILKLEDVNQEISVMNIVCPYNPDVSAHTLLGLAIKYNNIQLIDFLLSLNKIDINKPDCSGTYPLHQAIVYNLSIAKKLVELGANVNVRNKFGYSPLQYEDYSLSLSQLKTSISINPDEKYNTEKLDFLITKGADVNHHIEDQEYWYIIKDNVLQTYAKYYKIPAVKKLLSAGAYINDSNNWGWTALHYSAKLEHDYCAYGDRVLSKLFLEKGFDILQRSKISEITFTSFGDPAPIYPVYREGDSPIKFIPVSWIRKELKKNLKCSIYSFELYRGIKFKELHKKISKTEAVNFYPSFKGIDFAKGCFTELKEQLNSISLDTPVNRNIVNSIVKNSCNLTRQLFNTNYEEPIQLQDFKSVSRDFIKSVCIKIDLKKGGFTNAWYKVLCLCKEEKNLGYLSVLPKELKVYIGSYLLSGLKSGELIENGKGFAPRPIFDELKSIVDSLQKFETLLSGLSSDEFNNSHDY